MSAPRRWHIYWRPASGGWWRRWPGDHATRGGAIRHTDKQLRGIARAVFVTNIVTGETWHRRAGAWFKTRDGKARAA